MSASSIGIDAAFDMDHVVVLEAAQHIGDGVDLADIGEELIAEPFALRGAAHQPGNIDEGEPRGDHLRGLGDGREPVEPRIGHRHVADIGLDGAERIIGGLGRGALRQRVEQGGLADIGQPDDAAFESHDQSAFTRRTSGAAARPASLSASVLPAAFGLLAAWRRLGARRGLASASLGFGLDRMRHAGLEFVVGAFGEVGRFVGDGAEQRLEPVMIRLGKIVQHIAATPDPCARDGRCRCARAHSRCRYGRSSDLQTVMAGDAAAGLHPHLAGREVELVMEHHDVAELELVEAHGLAHGAARFRS